jgi:hypothetical protein
LWPDPRSPGEVRVEIPEPTRQNSKKEFQSQGAVQRQVELEFRSLESLAVWVDQEEESVQLVSEEFK